MVGSSVAGDQDTVQDYLNACQTFDLAIREANALGDRKSDRPVIGKPGSGTTLMGCVRLLPGARDLVTLAHIARTSGEEVRWGRPPAAPHERDAALLLTRILPVATWHAIARCISLAVKGPDLERACVKAIWRDLRPRLRRSIACAALADADAAVGLMFATAALTLMWVKSLREHGGSEAVMDCVSSLAVELETLHVLEGIPAMDEAGGDAGLILYSARRKLGAVVHDRRGLALREQDALLDLAQCASLHGGCIEGLRQELPEHRYAFARLLLRQGWTQTREIARSASSRRRLRPEFQSIVRPG